MTSCSSGSSPKHLTFLIHSSIHSGILIHDSIILRRVILGGNMVRLGKWAYFDMFAFWKQPQICLQKITVQIKWMVNRSEMGIVTLDTGRSVELFCFVSGTSTATDPWFEPKPGFRSTHRGPLSDEHDSGRRTGGWRGIWRWQQYWGSLTKHQQYANRDYFSTSFHASYKHSIHSITRG